MVINPLCQFEYPHHLTVVTVQGDGQYSSITDVCLSQLGPLSPCVVLSSKFWSPQIQEFESALRVSREDKNVRFFFCLQPFMLKVWKFMGAECEDITYHRAAGPVTDQKGDRDWGGSPRPGAGLYPAVPDSLDPLSGAAQSLLSRELAVSWQTREHNLSHSEDVTPRSLDSLSDSQQPSSSRNFWY